MKLLAIDTSTILGGAAVIEDDNLIAETRMNVKITHSERIMGEIDYIVKRSGLKIDDIDVFAIAIGPGSFTGLRVGLSTIKGLVYAAGKRLVSVSTLHALAYAMPFSKYQVCTLLDARKKEVYAGIFKWTNNGFIKVMNEQIIKIDNLLSVINESTIFSGEGAMLYKEYIKAKLGDAAIFALPHNMVTSPSSVAYLAMMKAKKEEFDDPITLVPMYIRKSEAERRQFMADSS